MGLIFVAGSKASGTNQAPHPFHRASPELKILVEDNEHQHIRARRTRRQADLLKQNLEAFFVLFVSFVVTASA